MNRSPSPDLTAKRAERQFQRIAQQQQAVAQVATQGVESVVISTVAPGGPLDTRFTDIEDRLTALEI